MEIKVGMADMNVCSGDDSIITLGLGSCVGVVLWDSVTKVCGMVHVMLPDSKAITQNTNRAKFADTGVEDCLAKVVAIGGKKERIVAKIAGGAQMFSVNTKSPSLRIGERNVEAVKEVLAKLGIKVVAEDTGLNYGRTVIFFPATGNYVIKSIGKDTKTI